MQPAVTRSVKTAPTCPYFHDHDSTHVNRLINILTGQSKDQRSMDPINDPIL